MDNSRLHSLRVTRMALSRWLALTFIGALMIANVSAQTKKSFTMNELIVISLESSPQVLAAREQVKAIKRQLSTARAIPNPDFEVGTGQQRSATGPLTMGSVSSWAVTQPLNMPYTRLSQGECC
ncbi:TolC family protein [Polynucleobacter necessarius]|uniref:TolC family protein n=1 Tax=Polynucleobacter necessarius TaxID=576610 RepID=UPI0013B06A5B|nr:TolC family protein [Polynucleobacter necessarius]